MKMRILQLKCFFIQKKPWQSKDKLIQVNRIITTPDGKLLGVAEV